MDALGLNSTALTDMGYQIFNADSLAAPSPIFAATVPASPTANIDWIDTSSGLRYYSYNSQWVQYPSASGPQGAAGVILQVVQATNSTYSAPTTVLPFVDNSTPTSSDGTSVLSQAISLASASNRVRVEVSCPMIAHPGAGAWFIFALFRNTTCIDAGGICLANANYGTALCFHIMDTPAAASATYSLRIGPAVAGNVYINGTAGSRFFGGSCVATLTLSEVKS